MAEPKNHSAYLTTPSTRLTVLPSPLPTPGPDEILLKNHFLAINPLDTHMQSHGVFITSYPAVFGCDVAGTIHSLGPNITGFKPGDRVIGHTVNLTTGENRDGGFSRYTILREDKVAMLPRGVGFKEGVVLPMAVEAAVCALCKGTPGIALPGVDTPAMGLALPTLADEVPDARKVLVVYGGSSSVGSMTTQIAVCCGVFVVAITGRANWGLSEECGAGVVVDRNDDDAVGKVVEAVKSIAGEKEFVGIFDAISLPETYADDLRILAELGGGHLACTHPPPENVPENVKAGMIFAVDDVATEVWREFVTPALETGKLKCLPPPTVVGKGLEFVEEGLRRCKEGVSGTKLVVEL